MAFLAWQKSAADLAVAEHPTLQLQLTLRLSRDEARELAAALREVQEEPRSELRHTISGAWTVFWKLREGESRSLLAHPEPESWVATLALEPGHLARVVERLESGSPEFALSELAPVDWISNFELIVGAPE
jgi:hypothetical protein